MVRADTPGMSAQHGGRRTADVLLALAVTAAPTIGLLLLGASPVSAFAADFTSPTTAGLGQSMTIASATACPAAGFQGTRTIDLSVIDQTGTAWTKHSYPVNVDGSWSGTLMAPLSFGSGQTSFAVHATCHDTSVGLAPTRTYTDQPLALYNVGPNVFQPATGTITAPTTITPATPFTVASGTPCPAPPADVVTTGTSATATIFAFDDLHYIKQNGTVTPAGDGSWRVTLQSPAGTYQGHTDWIVESECDWLLPESSTATALKYTHSPLNLVPSTAPSSTGGSTTATLAGTVAGSTGVSATSTGSSGGATLGAPAGQLATTGRHSGALAAAGSCLVMLGGLLAYACRDRWAPGPWDIVPATRIRRR
jgi:hypothetical protein